MKATHCAVDDCDRLRSERSVHCATHQSRLYRTGTTDPGPRGPRIRREATGCAAPDCNKPGKGESRLCRMHATRMERHGNLIGKQPHAPAPERFFAKIDRSGDCWLWTAGVNNNGYGLFFPGPGSRNVYAHRWSYEHHVGPIGDLHIMHSCDTPRCVNPAHMSLGTPADNAADKAAKGRAKTKTCFAGHPWKPETTSITVSLEGYIRRRCRICRNNRQRKRPV